MAQFNLPHNSQEFKSLFDFSNLKTELPSLTALGVTGAAIGSIPSLFFKSQKNKKLRNMLLSSVALPALYLGYASQRNSLRNAAINEINKHVEYTAVDPLGNPVESKPENNPVWKTFTNALQSKDADRIPGIGRLRSIFVQDPFEWFNNQVWDTIYPKPVKPQYDPSGGEFRENLRNEKNKLEKEYAENYKNAWDKYTQNRWNRKQAYDNWDDAWRVFNEASTFNSDNYTPEEIEELRESVHNARQAYYNLFSPDDIPDEITLEPDAIRKDDQFQFPDYQTFLKSKGFDRKKELVEHRTKAQKEFAPKWEKYLALAKETDQKRKDLQNRWAEALAIGYGAPISYMLLRSLLKKRNKKKGIVNE